MLNLKKNVENGNIWGKKPPRNKAEKFSLSPLPDISLIQNKTACVFVF